MDWKAGDILYSYQGNYDADGNFVPGKEIKAKCTGIDAAGKPEIAVLTGAEFLESGTRMIRVGSFNTAARQKGMFFDTITASAPRLVIYNGFNNYNKFSEDYIVDPSLYITVAGALDSVYNENLGGYLTGQVGLYTKSLFADISGSSKLYIREDANNYIYFDEGNLSLSATRFSLTSTNLGIFSGASAMILLGHPTLYASAKIGLKNDGSGKLASGNISWDTSGNVTQTGTWTSTATITGGTFQTAGSGNRVVMNSSGLYGYDNTLGTTFSLPTNGDKPTFSSGIIKEVEFEIYTSGIIRTSATVGSGSSNSAGVLMNNTGLYGFGANQNTSSANFKLLASTGEIFAKLGTIGGFTIGATSITSTNVGWHSGASAMFLLGHATDYASAKIGLKNDGSGKLASGNISWTAAGVTTITAGITATTGTIGGFTIGATSITSINVGWHSGVSAMFLLGHATDYASAKIRLKNDGSGKLASGNISWDTSGNVTQTGTWTSTATITGGTFQTAGSGNRVVMNSSGLYGYDNTLGTTFSLPTNGDKPTFSSGIIKEVEFEIYTSGIIRTSATVGSGSSNSAGVLMNNTGLYGFGANQNTSSANFKLLASTGEIFAKLGTIGGFTIGATSITSTNVGWHSGASAMFLLGHATDYASAKIGLKNDGSGKLASGNISWDTTGNVTQTGTWTSTATITGAIIKTATTGPRITINESGYANTIRFYDSNGDFVGGLYGDYGWLGVNGILNADYGINIPDNSYVIWGIPTFSRYGASIHSSTNGSNATIGILQGNTAPTQGSDYICYMDLSGFSVGGKQSGVTYARLDYLGRLTKVNNLAASSYTGYVLRSDGTSFTPQQLAFGSFSTTYYLAPSSGGSPTIPVRILPYTVGSTTRYLLAVE